MQSSKVPAPLSLSQLTISSPSMSRAASTATQKTMTTSSRLLVLQDHVALTRESRVICEKVLTRLHVLNRQLEHMVSMSTGSNGSGNGGNGSKNQATQQDKAMVKISELVTLFEQFVKCDTSRNIVLRLTDGRRFRQIQDLHEELDATFRMLRLEHVDPERQWRSEWAADRDDVEKQFQQSLSKREVLFRELNTPSAQEEALAVLRFAMEQQRANRGQLSGAQLSSSPEMIRTAFRKLVSMATVETPVIPTWLISPAMLSFEDVPFAGGEQAQVFRASWGLFKTSVVIKRPTRDAYRQTLLHEAELWSKLDHPSVLRMHGGFPVGDNPFLVLEYPANGPLDEYLVTSTEQHQMTFRLLWQAANGLKFIHDQRAHCSDLKLNSIFVGSDGVAKIGQFVSFFRAVGETIASTGSIRWKAPEILRESADIDAFAVDVYAFAMCILEAITGDLPWGWIADAEVKARVLEGQLPDRPNGVSDGAWNLIVSMCDADPAKRPTMKAVVKQMQVLAEEEENEQARTGSLSSSLGSSMLEDLDGDEYRPESRRKTVARATMLHSDSEDPHSFHRGTVLNSGTTGGSTDDTSTTIVVTLHHKWLGIKINAIGNRVVVSKFLRSSSGALGEIEASGQVRLGDVIVAVNSRSVVGMDRNQVGQTIQNTPRPLQLMFKREANLLQDCFQFHGLRIEERWRDRGSIVPMPEGAELMLGSVFDTFTFGIWFSLSDSDDTVYGGILLGAQDLSCEDQAWPYTHHQLVMVDPHGNLSSFFLQDETPVLIARELQPSRWYHLVVTYDSQAVMVYLDGQLKHQAKGVLYRQWPKFNHLNIGSGCISRAPDTAKPSPDFCGWYGFNGLIHDACVWHTALRELDVQQLFRGADDFVDVPVYSLRRDAAKDLPGSHPPRRVVASRPVHVVAQTYN